MAQAKTLNKQELKRVLDYNDACERHSERNRAMLLFTHLCGMRIGEVVALRVCDVIFCNISSATGPASMRAVISENHLYALAGASLGSSRTSRKSS